MKHIFAAVLGIALVALVVPGLADADSFGKADTRISIGIGTGNTYFGFNYFDDSDWWYDDYRRDYYVVYYPCCTHWRYCTCGRYRPWYYYHNVGWYRPTWSFSWRYGWYPRDYWTSRHSWSRHVPKYDRRRGTYETPSRRVTQPERVPQGIGRPSRSELGGVQQEVQQPFRSSLPAGDTVTASVAKPGRVSVPTVPDEWVSEFRTREGIVAQPSQSSRQPLESSGTSVPSRSIEPNRMVEPGRISEPSRISERPRQPESLRESPDSGSRVPNLLPREQQEPQRIAPRAPSVEPRTDFSEPIRFGNEANPSAPKEPSRVNRPAEVIRVVPSEPRRSQPSEPARPERSTNRPVAPQVEAPRRDSQPPARQEPARSVPQSRSMEQPRRSVQSQTATQPRGSVRVESPSRSEPSRQTGGQFGRSR